MQTDLFLTQEWFDLLRQHGLEQPPYAVQVLDLPSSSNDPTVRLWLRQVGPKSAWSALSNYYTGIFGPEGDWKAVTAVGWADLALRLRMLPGGGVITLEPLDAAQEWVNLLEEGSRQAGYRTWREAAFGNWYQAVEPGNFQAYWAERPSALRNTVDRARRRLDKAGPWRVEVFSASAGVDSAALTRLRSAYLKVYGSSWKPREPNPGFMPAFMTLAAEQGCLRLGVLWRGDEAVAAQLWLVYPGQTAQIFKLAHVQGQEKWSAGSVLTTDIARHVIDVDGVTELDFLSGDDPYKADWMAFRRERVRLVLAHPWSPSGWLRWTRYLLERPIVRT